MSPVPEEILALLRQRDAARAAKDFALADQLREQVSAAGFVVRDAPEGSVAEPKPRYDLLDPRSIENDLSQPATCALSFHLLYEGYPDDLERFLRGFDEHNPRADTEIVVIDNGSDDAEQVHTICERHPRARALHLSRAVGWAEARNAGLKTSRGAIVVLADLSIEPVGDICTPLLEAFTDPAVAVAGPFGLVSDDMRSWRESRGPHVSAIEGYLLATRRELLARGMIHEKFRWYRNADIDLSFQLREGGGKAIIVPLPVEKHTHRGWSAVPETERDATSKKNYSIFLTRWGARPDLLEI